MKFKDNVLLNDVNKITSIVDNFVQQNINFLPLNIVLFIDNLEKLYEVHKSDSLKNYKISIKQSSCNCSEKKNKLFVRIYRKIHFFYVISLKIDIFYKKYVY